MTEQDMLAMYAFYLRGRGYRAYKIPETDTETPDLIIDKGYTILLNEFKSPELIANQGSAPFVYKFKTSMSKIRRNIDKAVGQLGAYDPEHAFIWVVTFASIHPQLHWKSFTDALAGKIVNADGSILTDFTKTPAFQNTEKHIRVPDLYVWLQVNPNDKRIYQVSLVLNKGSKKHAEAEVVAKDLNSIQVSKMGMDNMLVFEG